MLEAFLRERATHSLYRTVYITQCLCLGVCPANGTTVVVYPDGTWYVGVRENDVAEIFAEHLIAGRPVTRLVDHRYG